jgi:sugar/nucleoside kinase (ribokinase family)
MNSFVAVGDLNIDAIFVGPLPKLVGDDAFGGFLKQKLDSFGVRHKLKEAGSTAITMIHTSQDRALSTFLGCNKNFKLNPSEISTDHIHLASPFLTPSLDHLGILKYAKKSGITTSLTTGDFSAENAPYVMKLLPWVDIFFPNKREINTLIKKPIERAIKELPCPVVVTTLGADGALVYSERELFNISAPKVKVVDTTGAGDVFAAAFLLKKENPRKAAEFGVQAASFKVQGVGQTYPTMKDLEKFK